jgi:hypothetical protein
MCVLMEEEWRVVYVLSGFAMLFLALLVIGAVTGRVKIRSCCSVGDASRDKRMRAAFEEEPLVAAPDSSRVNP